MNNMVVATTLKYLGSNEIPDEKERIIKNCSGLDINISLMDIEICHRLPLGRNATNTTKRVIVKLVS